MALPPNLLVFTPRSPSPLESLARKGRRFMVPTLVEQGYFSESLGRWLVPIGDYLDEIHHCLLLGKKMGGGALVERLIRKHVERTLDIQFRKGRRGFRQWLLEHQARTRRQSKGHRKFRKHDGREVNQPTLCFHPAMKPCPRLGIREGDRTNPEMVGGKADSHDSWPPVMPLQHGFPSQAEE